MDARLTCSLHYEHVFQALAELGLGAMEHAPSGSSEWWGTLMLKQATQHSVVGGSLKEALNQRHHCHPGGGEWVTTVL